MFTYILLTITGLSLVAMPVCLCMAIVEIEKQIEEDCKRLDEAWAWLDEDNNETKRSES